MSTKSVHAVFMASLLAGVLGCTSIVIEGSGDIDKTTTAQKVEQTVHASFWGSPWGQSTVSKCEKNHELYRLKFHQNALYVVVTLATVGLYVPQAVEWWCVPRENSREDEGPSLTPRPRLKDRG